MYLYQHLEEMLATWCKAGNECLSALLVVVGRWRGAESIYWCGYLVLWQAGSLNQPATTGLGRALHAHPRTSVEEVSAKPNLINKCSFSCATAIWDDGDVMWKRTKWWRQHREKLRERRRHGETCFLKAKCLSTGKQRDNMLIYFNKKHAPCNTPFPRSKSQAFICWRQSRINYQNLELKNKNCPELHSN